MDKLQKLEQIYNLMMQLKVEGRNVIILGNCIIGIEEILYELQQEKQSPPTVQQKEMSYNDDIK